MDEVIEFLDNAVLIYGKLYRDYYMIPPQVCKGLSFEINLKIREHLLDHEKILTRIMPKHLSIPLESFYMIKSQYFDVYYN
jgi:hypothetical protein